MPPDTFRATQFRDLAGLDFPFYFFYTTIFLFFFMSWKPASYVCSCVLRVCVAGWLRFLHMLVCSLLLQVMHGISSCSMAGLCSRRSDGRMVSWSAGQDIAGILRRCLCEAFLQAIFHRIPARPGLASEFSPLFVPLLQLP